EKRRLHPGEERLATLPEASLGPGGEQKNEDQPGKTHPFLIGGLGRLLDRGATGLSPPCYPCRHGKERERSLGTSGPAGGLRRPHGPSPGAGRPALWQHEQPPGTGCVWRL